MSSEKRKSKARGKLRGLGVGSYLEVTAPPNKEMGGIRFENARRRDDDLRHARLRPGARGAVRAGAVAARLGIPFENIRLLQGDSDEIVFGAGTGGSRSAMMGGGGDRAGLARW